MAKRVSEHGDKAVKFLDDEYRMERMIIVNKSNGDVVAVAQGTVTSSSIT